MPPERSAEGFPDEVARQESLSNQCLHRHASNVQIEIISDESRFAALEPVWNELLQQSGSNIVFLTFEWLSTWWQHFASGNQLFILVARKDGTVVGLAPLMIRGKDGFRDLTAIGGKSSDYKDFIIVDEENRESILTAMVQASLGRSAWDRFNLIGLREDSPNLSPLGAILSSHFRETSPSCDEIDISPYIQIGQPWEDYWESLKGKWRNDCQRTTRLLKKDRGEVVFHQPTDANEVRLYMEEFMKLHRIRRKEVDRTQSVFEQPAMVSFYTELAKRMFERNWLNLSALLVSGEVAAIHFGFEYSGNLLYYMPTFSHSYLRYSVGRSLLIHLLNDCYAQGFNEFDLLMGNVPYKFDFNPRVRKLYKITLFHRSLRGQSAKIWFRGVRPKLEALVNEPGHLQQIRAWFRKGRSLS